MGSVTVEQVEQAIRELGGEADWKPDILEQLNKIRKGDWSNYDSYDSYEKTAYQVIQQHCEGYAKYSKSICFQKVENGHKKDARFRLIHTSQSKGIKANTQKPHIPLKGKKRVNKVVSANGGHKSNRQKMRALSIRQPFAELIMTGEKKIEYRSRQTHIRGPVYIYACKAHSDSETYQDHDLDPEGLPHGALVGTVEIVDCTGDGFDFEWHLANPQRLPKPLPVNAIPQPGFFWPFGK